jgi:hypothetical protein
VHLLSIGVLAAIAEAVDRIDEDVRIFGRAFGLGFEPKFASCEKLQ